MSESGGASALRRATAHVLVADVAVPQLDDATTHHVFRVLRTRDGETVTVTDGRGSWRACRAAGGALVADGPIESVPAAADPITIGVAIPKADRPEWIVQKLTELGVGRIVFLHCDRSVVRWDDERAERHLTKLRRVAAEALQQSRGVWLPAIEGPVVAANEFSRAVIAEPGGRSLTQRDHQVLIGPEGGWSDEELAAAPERVSLGSTVLRVETAALAAAVLMSRERSEKS